MLIYMRGTVLHWHSDEQSSSGVAVIFLVLLSLMVVETIAYLVGLPPGATDSYYTQPASPYNPASIRPLAVVGETAGGRKYKSAKWADRLQTPEEKAEVAAERESWPMLSWRAMQHPSPRSLRRILVGGAVMLALYAYLIGTILHWHSDGQRSSGVAILLLVFLSLMVVETIAYLAVVW